MDAMKKAEDRKARMMSSDKRLAALLKKQPELVGKLIEALEADRFFITITFQKKYKPTDKHDLHHYYRRWQFEKIDVLPSLKIIVADFKAREMPGASIETDEWI